MKWSFVSTMLALLAIMVTVASWSDNFSHTADTHHKLNIAKHRADQGFETTAVVGQHIFQRYKTQFLAILGDELHAQFLACLSLSVFWTQPHCPADELFENAAKSKAALSLMGAMASAEGKTIQDYGNLGSYRTLFSDKFEMELDLDGSQALDYFAISDQT